MPIGRSDAVSHFVMPGLDPAIHAGRLPPASARHLHGQVTRHAVDARVKPGPDGSKTGAGTISLRPAGYPDAHGVQPGHDEAKAMRGTTLSAATLA